MGNVVADPRLIVRPFVWKEPSEWRIILVFKASGVVLANITNGPNISLEESEEFFESAFKMLSNLNRVSDMQRTFNRPQNERNFNCSNLRENGCVLTAYQVREIIILVKWQAVGDGSSFPNSPG